MRTRCSARSLGVVALLLLAGCAGVSTAPDEAEKAEAEVESQALYDQAYAEFKADRESAASATLVGLLDRCPPALDCPLRDEAITLLATMLSEAPWDGASPGDEGLERFDRTVGRDRAWAAEVLLEVARWLGQSNAHDRAAAAWLVVLELDPCADARATWMESLAVSQELSGDLDAADATRAGKGVAMCPEATP